MQNLVVYLCSIMSPQNASPRRGSHIGCMFYLSASFITLCVFKCLLKLLAWKDTNSHWLHLFDFSPLCVLKCFFKFPALADAKPHWLHMFEFVFVFVTLVCAIIFLSKLWFSRFLSITIDQETREEKGTGC